MKTRICCFLAGAILTFAAAAICQQAPKAEDLYQEALIQMEGRGNYSKALEIFKQIMKDFPENRQLAARSLFQTGVCYESLGMSEAQKAYQRLIKEFADQREVAAEARSRLHALESALQSGKVRQEHTTPLTRQVWAGAEVDDLGSPSPDGRVLSFVDWETGDLAIRNLETGEKQRVTKKGSWEESGEFALFSIFSPDGKQIAYNWLNKDDIFDLRLIASDGSGQRVLHRDDTSVYVGPLDWSPDGKQILAQFIGQDYNNQLAVVSADDGSKRLLKELGWRTRGRPFSLRMGSMWPMTFHSVRIHRNATFPCCV